MSAQVSGKHCSLLSHIEKPNASLFDAYLTYTSNSIVLGGKYTQRRYLSNNRERISVLQGAYTDTYVHASSVRWWFKERLNVYSLVGLARLIYILHE